MARRLVVEALFDLRLEMLCPEADAEGLALQHEAAVHQHPEGVAGRVAHREHQRLTGERTVRGLDADELAVPPLEAGEGCVEVDFPAQRLDLFSDRSDDAPQQVGADMGLLLPGDFLRRAVLEEHFGHEAAELVADAGGELTVREGSGAALAELDVGVFVQLTGGGEMLHGLDALVQRRAAFQHDGPVSLTGQQQRRKEARRAEAADHRPVRQRQSAVLHREIGLAPDGDAAGSTRTGGLFPLLFQGHGHSIHQLGLAMAGVHREPGDAQMAHLSPGDTGEAEGFFVGLRLPGGEGQANIMDQDHILSYFLSCTAPHSCPAQKFCRWPAHRGGRRCSAGRWRHRSRRRRSQ